VPDQAAAAAFGFVLVAPETPAPVEVPVWAELWPAVQLFLDLRGQWLTGPGGPIALNHAALPAKARPGMAGRRGRLMFEQLQIMEAEALDWFAEQRKKPGVR
jgi:hypothetical protein